MTVLNWGVTSVLRRRVPSTSPSWRRRWTLRWRRSAPWTRRPTPSCWPSTSRCCRPHTTSWSASHHDDTCHRDHDQVIIKRYIFTILGTKPGTELPNLTDQQLEDKAKFCRSFIRYLSRQGSYGRDSVIGMGYIFILRIIDDDILNDDILNRIDPGYSQYLGLSTIELSRVQLELARRKSSSGIMGKGRNTL